MTGTFSAHWESEVDRTHGEGPEGVSAGGDRVGAQDAARVSVLLYDDNTIYTAGEVPFPDLPPWPQEGMVLRPRPIGAPRDGSAQEIPWEVECELVGAASADERARLDAAIAADPGVGRVESTLRRARPPWKRRQLIIQLEYTARGMGEACLGVTERVDRALERELPGATLLICGVGGPIERRTGFP